MSRYELRDGVPWVDDRPVSWAHEVRSDDHAYGEGHAHHTRGFHVAMENGLVLSTQWGSHTYSDNHGELRPVAAAFRERSLTAELACWWAVEGLRSMLVWPGGDCVCGWVKARVWWELLRVLGEAPTRSAVNDDPRVGFLVSR